MEYCIQMQVSAKIDTESAKVYHLCFPFTLPFPMGTGDDSPRFWSNSHDRHPTSIP